MSLAEDIFMEVSPLKPLDKLQLIDKILESLNPVNKDIEKIWVKEVEERLASYNKGHLSSVSEKDVFAKYNRS
ncbi:MAG: addiction module protein [Flavobacteriaceae bacterium]|nr:addiction module protein [Bacteroidales bacterium]MCK5677630.1 addiction module protein [Flavobacteriaceae bacterium]